MEVVREMIHDQDISMHLWAEAARKAVYVQNSTPHRVLENKKSSPTRNQKSAISKYLAILYTYTF